MQNNDTAADPALTPATGSALAVEKAWSKFNVEMVVGYRKQVDEMATLMRKLVRCVRKSQPDSDIAKRSMDYLARHGLSGTTLRREPNPKLSDAASDGGQTP